jgi:hypothetical protein
VTTVLVGWPALMTPIVSVVVPTRDEMAKPATASPASGATTAIFRCVVRSAQ